MTKDQQQTMATSQTQSRVAVPQQQADVATGVGAPVRHVAALHGAVLLFYTGLAVLLTWPLVLNLGSAYPATPGEGAQDLWQNLWNLWWVSEAWQRGIDPFFTDVLFYPEGASLLFHPLNLTSGVLGLPLRSLFGQIVAYNLLVLLSFLLSGYALFLLARQCGCSVVAALLGGLIYTASAFHFFHLRLGHLEQISMQWLPLYALALDGLLRRPTVLRVLATAMALLLIIFTSLYMALYAALLTVLWVVWRLGAWLRAQRQATTTLLIRPAVGLAAMCGVVFAVVGPVLLFPMLGELQQTTYAVRTIEDAARGSSAPADAILPPATHPLRALFAFPQPYSPGAFLGFVPLLLALYGAFRQTQVGARWLVLAMIAWLLSLGPALPLYRTLYEFPLLQVARYPDRFTILVLIGVAVLAALGIDALLRRWSGRALHGVLGGLVLVLTLGELHSGLTPLTPPIDNLFYRTLAQEQTEGSVFELPINRKNNTSVDMGSQTIHGQPILYGALARNVPRIPFEGMPLIRELEFPNQPRDIVVQTDEERAATLRFFDLRYLIYHRTNENGPVTPPTAADLSRVAGVPIQEIYADDELVAYQIDFSDGPNTLSPFMAIGEGWYNLETTDSGPQRWLGSGAGQLSLYAPSETTVALRLTALAYQQERVFDVYVDDQLVAQVAVPPWRETLTTQPFALSGGRHTLRLVPVEPGTAPRDIGDGDDERPLSMVVFEVALEGQP